MLVREPSVADRFYPADAERCRREAERFLSGAVGNGDLPLQALGGIVPHAGWAFSGAVAGRVFAYLRDHARPQTLVITGTVHVPEVVYPSTMTIGYWRTPVGGLEIDCEFASRLVETGAAEDNPNAHRREHSLEVPLPIAEQAFPGVYLVPLMVPATVSGVETGRAVAEVARSLGREVLLVASTDLTHYGPNYRFTPKGVGAESLRWVKQENDARMLDAIRRMDAESLVGMARECKNACGPAATACVLAAARELGVTQAHVIEYTTSHDVVPRGEPTNFVGYVGAVF
ncbi:MAG: AmmeMemoRadiSam system protein B [Planctomycetes bacterium]|nr:AmmeMemoRadiSam system protein B [Planctomycetota bacterium]